jgi:hypothetical protein
MRYTPFVVVGLVATGCGEWPRHGHLPANDGAVNGTIDPSSLIELDWNEQQEAPGTQNDLPTDADVRKETLVQGQGHLFYGSIEGAGWRDSNQPAGIESASCPGAIGIRTPLEPGDYEGDVDFLMIVAPDVDATLCASMVIDSISSTALPDFADNAVGWDLGLLEVDACGIPSGPVLDSVSGNAVGIAGGSSSASVDLNEDWGVAVTTDKHYALYFAMYLPTDETLAADYTIGLSLVGSGPGGMPGVCPNIPTGDTP